MLRNVITSLTSLLYSRKKPTERRNLPCPRVKLWVEQLDARELLARLLWVGPPVGNQNWSEKENWRVMDSTVSESAKPRDGDDLIFDPAAVAGGSIQGADTNSTNDMVDLAPKSLTLELGYSKKIDLDATLRVAQQFAMHSGEVHIAMNKELRLGGTPTTFGPAARSPG